MKSFPAKERETLDLGCAKLHRGRGLLNTCKIFKLGRWFLWEEQLAQRNRFLAVEKFDLDKRNQTFPSNKSTLAFRHLYIPGSKQPPASRKSTRLILEITFPISEKKNKNWSLCFVKEILLACFTVNQYSRTRWSCITVYLWLAIFIYTWDESFSKAVLYTILALVKPHQTFWSPPNPIYLDPCDQPTWTLILTWWRMKFEHGWINTLKE